MTQEFEDWDALIKSPGWQRLIAWSKKQWGSAAYQAKIEQAIKDAETNRQDALMAIKVVNAVRHEIEIFVSFPQDRLETLKKAYERDVHTTR